MSALRPRVRVRSTIAVASSVAMVAAVLPSLLGTSASASTPPAAIVFSTQPGDGDPNSPLSTQPVVTFKDAASPPGTDTGASASITLSLDAVALSGQYVTGALSGCSSATGSGVVTFSGCKVSGAGKYTLTATDSTDNLTVTSAPFYISGPAQLVFSTQPGGGTAATAWSTQPVVTVENARGETLAADTTEIGVAIQGGTGTPGATLDCHNDGTAVNVIHAVAGVASYSDCKIDKSSPSSGTDYELYAVDPTDHLISAPSGQVSITAGAITQLAFTTPPAGANGGQALASQPVVALEDAGGNVVTSTQHVTLAIKSGTGTSGAALTCSSTDVAAVAGVATFAGCSVDKAGAGYQLTATDSTVSRSTTSTAFAITTGPAAAIAFSTQPGGNLAPGVAFGTQPVVSLTDAGGNPVVGTVTLSIKTGTGASGATLSCATNPLGTAAGSASYSGCSLDKNGIYKLTATSGSLSADSGQFSIGDGTPAAVAFAAVPGVANTGGSAFSTQPRVHVTDSGGQDAQGSVTLSIASGSGTPHATLTCNSTDVSTVSADATFSGCSIDRAGHGYRLLATLDGSHGHVTSMSAPFDVAIGDPAQLVFTSAPAGGTGGVTWADQPVVTVEDGGGNPVSAATGNVHLSLTASTGAGPLHCQDATIPLQLGRAQFAGCSVDATASAYSLSATWNTLAGVSPTFGITAGAPTHLVFTTQPSGGRAGVAFPTQPVVEFKDAGGNTTMDGAGAVALSLTAGTGTSGAALSACPGSCAVDKVGNGYTLTATSGGGLTTESLPFAVTTAPPTLGAVPAAGVPTAETFGGQRYGINPTDVVDAVNTATGSLSFASTDLRVAAIGLPFELRRSYNSADATVGVFGRGWSSLYDVGVTMVRGQTATVRGEDGQQLVYTWNAKTGTWVAPLGARGSLDCNSGNHCRFTRTDGAYWDVNTTASGGGQLQSWKAPDGFGLTFNWSPGHVVVTVSSMTSTPYQINATINAAGQITTVTTPAGRTVSYRYTNGLLTSVTDTVGRVWHFTYNRGQLLTSQTDGDGVTRLAASYDAAGHVTAVSAQGSAQHTDDVFSYASGVTTRRAHVSVGGSLTWAPYTYTYLNNFLTAQTEPSGAQTRYSYDTRGNLTTILDPLGFVQTLGYDAGNNLTSQTTPVSTVTMTYDSAHRILTRTDANNRLTVYDYDGPLLASIQPPGSTRTWLSYNSRGELTRVTGPLGQKVFGYDALGNQTTVQLQNLAGASMDGPGTSTTYDEAGDVLSSTDANGHVTNHTYDALGEQLTTTTPDGLTATNTYNGGGDLIRAVDGFGQSTTYSWDEATLTRRMDVAGKTTTQVYDPSGSLLSQSLGGATTTNGYDLSGQKVRVSEPSGVTTYFTYDLGDNAVLMTSTAGDTLTKQYDSVHRLTRQVLDGVPSRIGYDAANNVTSRTDAAGRTTVTTYNAQGLVASVHDAAGTTSYLYDPDGNLTRVTDPAGHVTTYTYDAANRRRSSSVGGNVSTYSYDNAGNVTGITDPDGRHTAYTLDVMDRPTATVFSFNGSSYTVTQKYDAHGRRIQMTDPTGTHDYTYDAAGNLTQARMGQDTFSYDYSQAGKITETYPDGTIVTYGLDDARNLMSVDSGTPGQPDYIHASYLRNAQRFTTGIAYSNGVLETRQLDQAGNVLDQSLQVGGSPVTDDQFTYDLAGDPLTQKNNAGGQVVTNKYGYDGSGRLTGFSTQSTGTDARTWPTIASGSNNAPTPSGPGVTPPLQPSAPVTAGADPHAPSAYTYDANGNQLSSAPSGTTNTYDSVDGLASSTTSAGTTTASYDRNGDLIRLAGPNGTETYTYDAGDHLVSVHLPSGRAVSYTYDGDGNRISKTVDGTTTQYVWDPANPQPQLAIERTGGGALIRRYIYGDGPIAMQTPTATFFYHLDPQGSAVELSDSNGNFAAAYHYDGFGNVTTTGANAPANPLLFQGEYLDPDTGLYYLGARNYDAVTGRFTQRDPIDRPVGVAAVSSYAFVNDRPTVLADPMGMFPTATDLFWSHNTTEANGAAVANYGVAGAKFSKSVYREASAYADDPAAYKANGWAAPKGASSAVQAKPGGANTVVAEKLSSSATAEEEIAVNIGEKVGQEGEAAISAGAELGAESGEAAVALEGAGTAAKVGGAVVGIVAVGLMTFVTVEDCLHDTVQKCVGDVVGEAVTIGFTIGCAVATVGVGALVCGVVGAAIGVALQTVITKFGPQIADGIVTTSLEVADLAVTGYGYAVAGINQGIAAISSGFSDVMHTLIGAGYTAVEMAKVLANTFSDGVDIAVNALVGFGYQISDVALALADTFNKTIDQAATLLKNTYAYTVTQVAQAIQSAYSAAADLVAGALKTASYAVDEVVQGLKSAYTGAAALTTATVGAVLKGLGYTITQITSGLHTVYNLADTAVTGVLKGLSYTASEVGAALLTVYDDVDSAVASALKFASYQADQIAGALTTVFDDAAAVTAGVLKNLAYGVNTIADALHSAYAALTDLTAAQILHNLAYTATEVAGALQSAFTELAQDATDALRAVGFPVDAVTDALKATYSTVAETVAGWLHTAGYGLAEVGTALKDKFGELDSAVVRELDTLSGDLSAAAVAIGTVFNEGLSAVADALKAAAYDANLVAGVLQTGFAQTAQEAAQLLKDAGYAIADVIGALQTVFNQAENAVASILNGVYGAVAGGLTTVANALETAYSQTAAQIAGVLSAIGIDTATIDAIGGAFASFGNAVASAVTDAWNTVSSWF